jgi:hypothetical protein
LRHQVRVAAGQDAGDRGREPATAAACSGTEPLRRAQRITTAHPTAAEGSSQTNARNPNTPVSTSART